ncbi:MAG: hypothetical protein IIV04_05220, partial [Bacteroidaceae bacterium]|nr:hypothetical protein [Bacteroidaceae bacterium]
MKKVFIALFSAVLLLSCGGKKDADGTATVQASERTEAKDAELSATSNDGEVAQKAPVASHECVDLGLPSGTMWATCNV